MPDFDQIEILRSIPLFNTLTDQEAWDFLAICKERKLHAGQELFKQGAPGQSMVVVMSGKMEVSITTPAGESVKLAEIGAGNILGEMALIDPAPRSATVKAVAASNIYEVNRKDFYGMAAGFHPAAFKILRSISQTLCNRLRDVYAKVGVMLDPTAEPPPSPTKPDPKEQPQKTGFLSDMLGWFRK